MNISKYDRPALVLVDIQKGFEDIGYWGGERNNPDAEQNAGRLLTLWRELNLPVYHVRHCSSNPESKLAAGKIGNEFQEVVQPLDNEVVISKNVNSAFIGTNLQELLELAGTRKIVVAGLTTDHCISTTVRMAGNLGFETWLAEDASATFCKKGISGEYFSAQLMHNTAIASLNEEFASIVKTNDLINAIQ